MLVLQLVRALAGGDVPFAGDVGAVAGGPEHLGERDAAAVEIAAVGVGAVVLHHMADAGLMRIEAGEQRGARGAAARHVVELREPHATRGERVEIRRGDLAAVATDVGVADIVGHDDDEVGALGGGKKRGGASEADEDSREGSEAG